MLIYGSRGRLIVGTKADGGPRVAYLRDANSSGSKTVGDGVLGFWKAIAEPTTEEG